ncbi:CbrC family protein [Streptomyces sp. NPDC004284]|uniref:CbrC family protein n=1 Tax=Streptomyces sp. NPDC004284 TaxID=3364695 RepID=UPI003676F64B
MARPFSALPDIASLRPPEALAMLRKDHERYGWTPPETEQFLRSLDRAGEPTAYLFRCLHCDTSLASWDIG